MHDHIKYFEIIKMKIDIKGKMQGLKIKLTEKTVSWSGRLQSNWSANSIATIEALMPQIKTSLLC